MPLTLSSTLPPWTSYVFIPAVVVCVLLGCKPSVPPVAGQEQPRQEPAATQPVTNARHRPEADDFAGFLRAGMPPSLKLVELKSDPPVPLPGTASGDNAWLYNVSVTFGPTEDLLGPPTPKEAGAFQSAVANLNALVAWSQAYAHSFYAARYPGFTVESPAPAVPRLLRIVHAKDKPSPPLYGKISAEWQVDHWNYAVVSLQMPADDQEGAGKHRSQYTSPILIQGSPEAERFLTQIRAGIEAAQSKKAAIEAAYHADLLKATQPGTLYRGQLRYQGKVTAAEVRFAPPPAGTDAQQQVQLEMRLPDAPDESFTYLALRAKQLPLRLPAPTTDTNGATDDDETPTLPEVTSAPTGDLTLSFVKASGKNAYNDTVPVALLKITRQYAQPTTVTLQVHDGRLEGRLNGYSTDPTGFVLSAQQSP